MINNTPKPLSKIQILQTPNSLNYSASDFAIILGDLCLDASETNTPKIVELSFLKSNDTTANQENTILKLSLPIIPERYGVEKDFDDAFFYIFKQRDKIISKITTDNLNSDEEKNHVDRQIIYLPFVLGEFLKNYQDKEYSALKKNYPDLLHSIAKVYPNNKDEIIQYFNDSIGLTEKLQGNCKSFVMIAENNQPVKPTQSDPKQVKRLQNYIAYELAQKYRWAEEDVDEQTASAIKKFKTFDDSFVIDKNDNCGRVSEIACEASLNLLEVFDYALKNQSQPNN